MQEQKKGRRKSTVQWKKLTSQERKDFLRKPFEKIKKVFSKKKNPYTETVPQPTKKKTTVRTQTFKKKSRDEDVKPSTQKPQKAPPKKQKKPAKPLSKQQEALRKRLADLERIMGKQKNKDKQR